ncbi:hypothetical protein [Kribbella sp. NPDC051137]|uniref:hypothetical protein n=1 Tax=Kribbella sp. NPDC051137 TaxID=3155045 RepID=UPI00344745E4
MVLRIKARQVPLRFGSGAFILNSGLSKLGMGEPAAAQTHGFAVSAYPELKQIDPRVFLRVLTVTELTLGAALMLPLIPGWLAGAGLTAFSGGLFGLYLRTPGLRKEGSLRPTDQGIPIAKDIWLLAIGLSIVIDDLTEKS